MAKQNTPAQQSSPKPSLQVVIALIGLVGVVAAAAIANWNTLFSPATTSVDQTAKLTAAPPAFSASTSGPQSPIINTPGGTVIVNMSAERPEPTRPAAEPPAPVVLPAVVGSWTTRKMRSVYLASYQFRINMVFERLGDRLTGRITETKEGSRPGRTFPMIDLRIDGTSVSFRVESTAWDRLASKSIPFVETYELAVVGKEMRGFRWNNAPTGGAREEVVATKDAQ